MTLYQPVHTSGRRGPTFAFATTAALWIIQQPIPRDWHWVPINSPAFGRVTATAQTTAGAAGFAAPARAA